MHRLRTTAVLAATLLPTTLPAQAQSAYTPRTVLARPMAAITDPPVIAATGAEVANNELVIGVVIGGQSRAYPINQLTGPQREIINDVLAGTSIAATW